MNKKNYVQYKTDVVEFIRAQDYDFRVAILKKFEFIEYDLDADFAAETSAHRQVVVQLGDEIIVFDCQVQLRAETGAFIIVNAAQKRKKV